MDAVSNSADNRTVIDEHDKIANKIRALRSGVSLERLSDDLFANTGVRISPQAMHKWEKKGQISIVNAKLIADYYGVAVAWLLLDEGPPPGANKVITLDAALKAMPEDLQREILDFALYKIQRAPPPQANETPGIYDAAKRTILNAMPTPKSRN